MEDLPDERTPFVDLPAALVAEALGRAAEVGDRLLASFQQLRAEQATVRQALLTRGLLLHESELGYPPLPTTCGADGSYGIERLLTADLAVAAAVAVEGLTPPSEQRHWVQPRHLLYAVNEPHHAETATILRAVMLGKELDLARHAPHDLVMLDGTLTLPIIYFNQALNAAPDAPDLHCAQEFMQNCSAYLEAYRFILYAERSDQHFISLPKYSTRREIGHMMHWTTGYDDRGLLTWLLHPGELTRPLPLEQPEQAWHLNLQRLPRETRAQVETLTDDIVTGLSQVSIFYYKPQAWLPALRVEVAQSIANNLHRLAVVVQGLKHQCATASMFEPYPLYLADRTVKALTKALPTFRQVATQRISEKYDGDIAEVFFAMHGYRSESGG